ncbi:hypothetical protein QJS10_CPA07g00062 [Acorus calamus]|uniref:Uncharacterized protein n=1 Tax=Acorus calamus TaxID=4465 RepID=A0AAV9EG87_ACOCL|nr:hypothetical protein QJS10_CPA07g00062 [Acorus calamus]
MRFNSDDEYDGHIDSHSEGFDDLEHEGNDLSDVLETKNRLVEINGAPNSELAEIFTGGRCRGDLQEL